jgi:hypothetical protein
MRSGLRTRLALGVVIVLALTLTATACTQPVPVADQSPTASTSPATSLSPSPSPTTPPEDPAVTADVCSLASAATSSTTKIFNDQIAALEQAAARNDQATMVRAAETINRQFANLAATLTQLAARAVSPALRTVLTDIATALTQMYALSYTGTTVDIRKKLLDFAAAFTSTCAPPASASATPSG